MPESPEQATERYLRSGEHDAHFRAWPGNDFLARTDCGDAALRSALIAAVHDRTAHTPKQSPTSTSLPSHAAKWRR